MSRWDALRTDTGTGRAQSSSSYTRRRRRLAGNTEIQTIRQHHGNFHRIGRVGDRGESSVPSSGRVTDNSELRSQHYHKSSQTANENVSKSKDVINDALDQFKNSVSSLVKSHPNKESSRDIVGNLRSTLNIIIKMLLPENIDPDSILDSCIQNQLSSSSIHTSLSPDLVSEIIYVILRGIKAIGNKSRPLQKECKDIIVNMSNLSSVCLGIFASRQQPYRKTERPRYFTDLRLCECVTILLDIIRTDVDSCTNDTTTQQMEVTGFNASLFVCLAKIMAVSTINWGNNKSTQKWRSPLNPWGPEKTATFIVKQSVLPFVKSVGDSTVSTALKLTYCQAAMECVCVLLNDHQVDLFPEIKGGKLVRRNHPLSKHAAAILAPLVVDVLPDGKEKHSRNPLRSEVIAAISVSWNWSCQVAFDDGFSNETTNGQIVTSCRSMTAVVNALYALKKGKYKCTEQNDCSPPSQELHASEISKQIHMILQIERSSPFRSYFLELLTSLSLMYPSALARHWHLFLEDTSPRHLRGDNLAVRKGSFLVSFVERGICDSNNGKYDDECWINMPHALGAISALISSMPLTLWISSEGRTSYRLSAGNFPSRVRQALMNTMSAILKVMSSLRTIVETEPILSRGFGSNAYFEHTMIQCSILAGQFCTILPFAGDNDVLIEPASKIVSLAADIYTLGLKMIGIDTVSFAASSQLIGKASSIFGHVILESLGSGVTDTGKAVAVSPPARQWLCDVSSYDFIGVALSKKTYRSPNQSKAGVDILAHVARSAPWVITREPFNLATFRDTCSHLCGNVNDAKTRILGLKLVESFLLGRKASQSLCIFQIDFPVVPEYFCPLLQSALKDEIPAVRISAISSFGALLQTDWRSMLLTPHESTFEPDMVDWTCINSILQATSDGSNSGIRSAACKAIGNIYSECIDTPDIENSSSTQKKTIPFCDAFAIHFANNVCNKMEMAIADANASVRSMAIFAMGNVASAMRGRSENSEIYIPTIKKFFDPVNACLDDRDEKVVGNAIRTIGHIAYFVYSPMYLSSVLGENAGIPNVFSLLLSKLSSKVELALCDAIGESSRDFSWKQRNSAKKHAWGACMSIGTLLSFSNMTKLIQYSVIETTLNQLFRCIQLHNIVHEKISASSAASLLKLPCSLWLHCSSNCGAIGRGLATCFGFINQRADKSSILSEIKSLTKVMLSAANSEDFCIMFLNQDDIPFDIEQMYQWLVSNDMDVYIFDKISLALEHKRVRSVLDVSVAQMFLTRTRHEHKSPCKSAESLPRKYSNGDESDDDGDEL